MQTPRRIKPVPSKKVKRPNPSIPMTQPQVVALDEARLGSLMRICMGSPWWCGSGCC